MTGLTTEPLDEYSEIGCSATDIGDDRVVDAGQQRRTSQRIARSGADGEDWECHRSRGIHDGAVVLRDERSHRQVELVHRVTQAVDDEVAYVAEGRVEHGGILALKKAQLPDLMPH